MTGDGGHSYIVVKGTVLRVCGWLYTVCAGRSRPTGDVNSEMAPLLVSPALRTLFGRLPRCAGDAAPPVVTDPGRLSPTRLLIKDSISRRLSARAGAGEINCVVGQQGRPGVDTVGGGLLTSLPLKLGRPGTFWVARSSLWRLSSASFAFFARISSRRCCIAGAVCCRSTAHLQDSRGHK